MLVKDLSVLSNKDRNNIIDLFLMPDYDQVVIAIPVILLQLGHQHHELIHGAVNIPEVSNEFAIVFWINNSSKKSCNKFCVLCC